MPYWHFLILSLLHLSVDCYISFLPALWLPIQCTFGLKEWQTGVLMGLVLMPANLLQPLYGAISDRFNTKWVVLIGPLLVVLCASMVGLSSHLLLSVVLMSLAAAAAGSFHPEAVTLAHRFGAVDSSKAMAVFIGAGFAGQAIGPWWLSQVISGPNSAFGDMWQTIFPGLIITVIAIVAMARLGHLPATCRSNRSLNIVLAGRHRAVWLLIALNVTRWCSVLLLFFTLPLYVGNQIDVGRWMSVFNGAQGAGIVLGGLTAPPRCERMMLTGSMVLALLPVWILPFIDGGGAALALISIGLLLGWTVPITLQLGQSLVPGGERWITGMLIGFSWGFGSLAMAPTAGYLCGIYSPRHALIAAAIMLTISLLFSTALPSQATLNKLRTQ